MNRPLRPSADPFCKGSGGAGWDWGAVLAAAATSAPSGACGFGKAAGRGIKAH